MVWYNQLKEIQFINYRCIVIEYAHNLAKITKKYKRGVWR